MENFSAKQWISIVILCSVVFFGGGLLTGREIYSRPQEPKIIEPLIETPAEQVTFYKVYITGAVKNPDVYQVEEGSIVKDLLDKAGGATEDADLIACNLAYRVHDGEKIVIPFKNAQNQSTTPSANTSMSDGSSQTKININTATLEQLMSLPGIGEVKGKAIIDYRNKNGEFKSIEEITRVSGIGTKTFEQIKDLITVF